ncbi:MAG: N-acetylmuramoyl-L-alanine amidase [Cyanobacteria bacterium HKST-UBA03]|nr:N-acetylmuramoyl-L-alanine amidase [Cyanobacteria bacterium HKST-UBA03]
MSLKSDRTVNRTTNTLTVVYPKPGHQTYEASTFLIGAGPANSPLALILNGQPPVVVHTNRGGFFNALIPLAIGANQLQLALADSTPTAALKLTIERLPATPRQWQTPVEPGFESWFLKRAVPTHTVYAPPGSHVELACNAPAGWTVQADLQHPALDELAEPYRIELTADQTPVPLKEPLFGQLHYPPVPQSDPLAQAVHYTAPAHLPTVEPPNDDAPVRVTYHLIPPDNPAAALTALGQYVCKTLPDWQPPATGRPVTIHLDAGHGGEELGAVAPDGTPEKQINLAVARQLQTLLEADSRFTLSVTRTQDEAVGLDARVSTAMAAGADFFISLHHNALPDGRDPTNEQGVCTFYHQPFARPYAEAFHQTLVNELCCRLHTDKQTLDYGLFDTPFRVIKPAAYCGLLVELGFLTHPDEALRCLDTAAQAQVAQAMMVALSAMITVGR